MVGVPIVRDLVTGGKAEVGVHSLRAGQRYECAHKRLPVHGGELIALRSIDYLRVRAAGRVLHHPSQGIVRETFPACAATRRVRVHAVHLLSLIHI